MTEVFVIRNQLGHYWGKGKIWVDGNDAKTVMRLKHRDEASNTLFELSSKDFELRGDIVAAEPNAKGDPVVEISDIPLPIVVAPEPPEAEESSTDAPLASAEDTVTEPVTGQAE